MNGLAIMAGFSSAGPKLGHSKKQVISSTDSEICGDIAPKIYGDIASEIYGDITSKIYGDQGRSQTQNLGGGAFFLEKQNYRS